MLASLQSKSTVFFCVALSGGSTPQAIYKLLCTPEYANQIEWDKVKLFWSDERSVAPTHSDSNYYMAMKAGFENMPLQPESVFRMKADSAQIVDAAKEYENTLIKELHQRCFDMVMLGMGDDGHTASLFPYTEALKEQKALVVANDVPTKQTKRMTLTFKGIHAAREICVYVMGQSKQQMLENILLDLKYQPNALPAQQLGMFHFPALWIADTEAAQKFPLPT